MPEQLKRCPFCGLVVQFNWYAFQCSSGRGLSGRKISSTCYDTPEEAAHAYDEMAKRLYGEFARLNFQQGGPNA